MGSVKDKGNSTHTGDPTQKIVRVPSDGVTLLTLSFVVPGFTDLVCLITGRLGHSL